MTYINRLFAKGIPTYEISGKRRSIIDVCLTNLESSVVNFAILPNVLGVNPQTSHRVLQLVLSETSNNSAENQGTKVRKFRYCTYDALCKIQTEVAERIGQLIWLRKNNESFYNYSVLKRIYHEAKCMFLGFADKTERIVRISTQARKLQQKITFTTAMYQRDKTDILLFKLETLYKQLKDRDLLDRHLEHAEWVCNLNRMDYQKSTRSFFAELGSKNKAFEYYGPIRDAAGELSTTLQGCLENWASYYRKLYKDTNEYIHVDQIHSQEFSKIGPKKLYKQMVGY